jgi:hypothetical protein
MIASQPLHLILGPTDKYLKSERAFSPVLIRTTTCLHLPSSSSPIILSVRCLLVLPSPFFLRVFLARRARVARNRVSTPMMFKASDCGRLGRQAAGHPWSALRVMKSCRKGCPTAEVLPEAKAAALHPERYQSLLSKLSTKEGG